MRKKYLKQTATEAQIYENLVKTNNFSTSLNNVQSKLFYQKKKNCLILYTETEAIDKRLCLRTYIYVHNQCVLTYHLIP